MANVLLLLADGVEECEALLTVDLLRRARINVFTASINDEPRVYSSHRVAIASDFTLKEIIGREELFDCFILPGGSVGTENLRKDHRVKELAEYFLKEGKLLCAICAAPSIYAGYGMLKGIEATVHPAFKDKLLEGGAIYTGAQVSESGQFITGEALGAAIPFALQIMAHFVSEEVVQKIMDDICLK